MSRFQLFAVLTIVFLLVSGTALAGTPLSCKACGRAITGGHFETGGDYYHPEHFTCAHCGQPIKGAYTVYREQNYHGDCFQKHVALRCAVCDEVIEGEYLIDFWGNASHPRHRGNVVRCDFCSRFIVGHLADHMVSYGDKRHLCSICSRSAITNLVDARGLMATVSRQLARYGLAVDPNQIELQLVDLRKLQKISRKRGGVTGFTDCEARKNLFGQTQHQTIKVYLLDGMPRVQMMSTLAHELTHVWLFLQGRLRHDKALAEGSCNYASYLVLQKIGGEEADYLIHNMKRDKDRIYGGGFRRVVRYVDKYGLSEWIRLLKKRDTMVSKF